MLQQCQRFFRPSRYTHTPCCYHLSHATFASAQSAAAMLRAIDLKKDYYKIIGVTKTAKTKEIRSKYFEAAKKYHPDVTAKLDAKEKETASTKFLLISQAYEILANRKKRKLYDTERQKRNYDDPNEIKKDFYKNVLREARAKGVDLNDFQTEKDAYKWWEKEQKQENQTKLKLWRRKVKQSSMQTMAEIGYVEAMNQHILVMRRALVWRNAVIAMTFGAALFMMLKYLTTDTDLGIAEYYLLCSPLLQQIANRWYFKFDKYDTKSPFIDEDGTILHHKVGKQANAEYRHDIHHTQTVPPSIA